MCVNRLPHGLHEPAYFVLDGCHAALVARSGGAGAAGTILLACSRLQLHARVSGRCTQVRIIASCVHSRCGYVYTQEKSANNEPALSGAIV